MDLIDHMTPNKKYMLFKDLFLEQSQVFLMTPLFLALGIMGHTYIPLSAFYLWGPFTALFYIYGRSVQNLPLQYAMGAIFYCMLGVFIMGSKAQITTGPYIENSTQKPLWIRGIARKIQCGPKEKKFQLYVESLEGFSSPPQKLQLSYKFKKEKLFKEGDQLVLKAMITPLRRPFLPDGCDYTEQKRFQNIGGEGYVTYIHRIRQHNNFTIYNIRESLTKRILSIFPGQIGAIVAALITGDSTAIRPSTRKLFVETGIAHILAISGLHLSLVGGAFFFLFRFLGGIMPTLYRRIPAQKIAAILSLFAACGYLFISGTRVPTVRAFIGFACVMGAILLNRPILSLRIVAVAALITLALFPESLSTPSFQLSFAAVTGLVACYEYVSRQLSLNIRKSSILYYICSLFVSSFVATCATLPFIMFHFGKISTYGILVNCIMVPLMGTILMPLLIFWVLGHMVPGIGVFLTYTITSLLKIAFILLNYAQQLPSNIFYTPPVKKTYFICASLGFFFFCILKTKWRLVGGGLFIISLVFMYLDPIPKPYLMLSNHGKTMGIYQDGHLFVTQRRRQTFLSDVWGTYLGVAPQKRHRLMDKQGPQQMAIKAYGKNYLIKGAFITWVEHEEKIPPIPVDLWISTIRKKQPSTKTYIGPKDLERTVFIYEDGKILSR
jgi:competence protein ComEC